MAIRKMRILGDDILREHCKEVKEMTPRTRKLIDDMVDTMYDQNGVGLAAVQVGVLKRIVVIDVGDGLHVFVNPVITEADGEQVGTEGCLSVPGKNGTVKRPNHVIVKALDENMQPFELEGTELMARCICHECDHLDGVLYVDKLEGGLRDNEEDGYGEEEEDEEEE